MTAGVYNCPWYSVLGIVAFGALCGWAAWRITAPATPTQVDPTDARQRFTHVKPVPPPRPNTPDTRFPR